MGAMGKWFWWGGLAFVAYKLFGSTKAESPSPTRVTWRDSANVAQSRDFQKKSVAEEFASALRNAGAAAVSVTALA